MAEVKDRMVYRHRRNDDNTIFYVGKGVGNRPYKSSGRNSYWKNIADKGYSVEIIADELSDAEAIELESLLIEEYKSINQCQANMISMDSEKIFTDEYRQKLSDAKKGKSQSQEHKDNISNSCTGVKKKSIKPYSEERKKNTSEAMKEVWRTRRVKNG